MFLDIDDCQKVQVPKETCDTNAWYNITSLKLTVQFPGTGEALINQWDEYIDGLRYLGKQPNEYI